MKAIEKPLLVVRLEPETHHAFKMLCLEKQLSMQQVVEGWINTILGKNKEV